jgi:hypothetical protein
MEKQVQFTLLHAFRKIHPNLAIVFGNGISFLSEELKDGKPKVMVLLAFSEWINFLILS